MGLVKALNLSKDKHANIYTDELCLHFHVAVYKERGLLTAGGKGIKNQNEILKLLKAVWEPKEVAVVIHCREHLKGNDSVSDGNRPAVTVARLAAKVASSQIMPAPGLPEPLTYTPQEKEGAQREGGKRMKEGWYIFPDLRFYAPEQLAHK